MREGFRLNEALGIAALIVAVVAIPLTYIWARRGKRHPRVKFAVDSQVLVDPTEGLIRQGLSLRFAGSEIQRVSRTYVAVWNEGGDTVEQSHVLTTDPVRVVLGEGDVALQARVVSTSRDQIGFSASLLAATPTDVPISWNFLDARDGAVVEILHVGSMSRPTVEGTIKGATLSPAVSSSRGVSLSPSTFDWSHKATRRERFKERLLFQFRGNRRAAIASFLQLVMLIVLTAAFWLTTGNQSAAVASRYLDVTQYNLNTRHGQARFSEQVVALGAHSATGTSELVTFSAITFALFILLLLQFFTVFGRAIVPTTIYRVLKSPSPAPAPTSPDPDPLPAASSVGTPGGSTPVS
jgi:hypothetical protein